MKKYTDPELKLVIFDIEDRINNTDDGVMNENGGDNEYPIESINQIDPSLDLTIQW